MNPEESFNGPEYNLVEPGTPSLYNDPDGDVILRTSDEKDFQVSKVILKLASPVFRTMFSLPQPSTSDPGCDEPLPVVPVSESSAALDLLLRLIHPVERPNLTSDTNTMATIVELFCAAKKYEIDFLFNPIGEAFKARMETSKEEALSGFALVTHRRLHMQAELAAKACLKWPLRDIINTIPKLTSGTDYVILLKYHERASQAVVDLFTNYDFLNRACSMARCDRGCCGRRQETERDDISMRYWWKDWSKWLISAFREAPLGVEVISLSTLSKYFSACSSCGEVFFNEWERGKNSMIDAIKREVEKVEIKFGWM